MNKKCFFDVNHSAYIKKLIAAAIQIVYVLWLRFKLFSFFSNFMSVVQILRVF